MKRHLWNRLVLGVVLGFTIVEMRSNSAKALDFEPIQDSTELGVTITTNQIFDAFEESLSFWPSVRRYVKSEQFDFADPELCAAADEYIGQVQDELHNRLMGSDQGQALDVIRYVTWNLRRNHFFRELHETAGVGELTPLVRRALYREVPLLARGGLPLDCEALLAGMEPSLKGMRLSVENEARARDLLRSVAQCQIAMEETETGKLLRRADESLEGQPCRDIVRGIVSAVDWAGVIKDNTGPARREHFIAAWEQLQAPPLNQTAGQ